MIRKTITLSRAALLVSAIVVCGFAQTFNSPMPAPGEAPEGSPVAKYGYLTATNGKLRGSKSGTTNVQLKGLSLFWSNGGDGGGDFYNESVVAWLAHDWQIDVIRAALGVDASGNNLGYCANTASGKATQAGLVKDVVEAAIKRGIYVLIDWHAHAAHNNLSCAETFFKEMVALYGKYPNVIYETYNEPMDEHQGTCQNINTYSNALVSTIRSEENSKGVTNPALIVIGTPQWSSQPQMCSAVDDSKSNLAYSLHFYAATHPGSADGSSGYAQRAKEAITAGRTVFATEWGSVAASGGGSPNTTSSNDWVSFMSTNGISWAYWSVTDKCDDNGTAPGASILKRANCNSSTPTGTGGGWAESALSPSGTYIRDMFPSGTNKKYTVTLKQTEGGTITKTPNTADHAYNESVTIKAAANEGWELMSWGDHAAGVTVASNAQFARRVLGIPVVVSANFYNGGLIKNGHFTSGVTSWSKTGSASNNALDNSQLKAAHSGSAGAVTSASVVHTNIRLDKGATYRLSFKARGQSNRKISVRLGPGLQNKEFDLTTTMLPHTVDFTHTGSDGNNILYFDFGDATTVWFLDDVSLFKTGESDDPCLGANPPAECGPCETSPGSTECCSQNAQHASCQTTDPCESANPPDYCNPDPCENPTSAECCALNPESEGCTSVRLRAGAPHRTTWSISRAGGALTLRGPVESGSRVTLYDVRGKAVRTVLARDGMTIGQNLPAGNYFAVVRNAAGKEVFKTRAAMVK